MEAIAKLFFERVWVHFGIPQTIILDQGQSIPQHILSEPVVTTGHQTH
jgi:hypothetical protein